MSLYLIVDNAPAIRLSLANQLKMAATAATVEESDAGPQAIALAAKNRFDAVFIGMGLANGERGLPVIQQLLTSNPDRPVIICTSMPHDHPDVTEALSDGAFAYLPKPVRADAVAKVLRDIEVDRGRFHRIR